MNPYESDDLFQFIERCIPEYARTIPLKYIEEIIVIYQNGRKVILHGKECEEMITAIRDDEDVIDDLEIKVVGFTQYSFDIEDIADDVRAIVGEVLKNLPEAPTLDTL